MQKENDPHKLSDFIELMENSIESKKCIKLEIEIDYDDIHLVQLLSVVEVDAVDEVVEGAGDEGGVAVVVQLGLLEPEGGLPFMEEPFHHLGQWVFQRLLLMR